MEFLQLKYFKLVAELENMSQAAKELNIVQSAVSRSVQRLEQELGTKLFDRKGRQIVLNERGKVAYNRTVEVLEAIDRLEKDVIAESQKVTIRLSVEAGSALMPAILAKYKGLCPDAEIILDQSLKSEAYDIRIRAIPSYDHVTKGELLLEESVKLLVPVGTVQVNNRNNIELQQLRGSQFIGLKSEAGLRKFTDGFMKSLDFTANYVFESDNPSMLRSMISSGIGCVFFPEYTWGAYDEKIMTMVGIEGHSLRRKLILESRVESDSVSRFYSFLKEALTTVLSI